MELKTTSQSEILHVSEIFYLKFANFSQKALTLETMDTPAKNRSNNQYTQTVRYQVTDVHKPRRT